MGGLAGQRVDHSGDCGSLSGQILIGIRIEFTHILGRQRRHLLGRQYLVEYAEVGNQPL